jgi:hypothetical protein
VCYIPHGKQPWTSTNQINRAVGVRAEAQQTETAAMPSAEMCELLDIPSFVNPAEGKKSKPADFVPYLFTVLLISLAVSLPMAGVLISHRGVFSQSSEPAIE